MSMNQPPFVPLQRSRNLQRTRSFIPGCSSPSDSAPRDTQKTCPPVPPRVGSLIRLRIEPIFRPSLHPCRQCNSIRDGSCQLSTSGQEHRYCSSSSEERFRGRVHAASVAVCKVRHIRHSRTEQTCRSMQPNLFRAHDHIAGFEAWRPPPSYAISSATGHPITCPNLATTRFRARKLPPLDQI